MPTNNKPSPDWRQTELRFYGGTINGKPLTGWIELIPDQHAFLDDDPVIPLSILARTDRVDPSVEFADLQSGVLALEVVATRMTLMDKDGNTFSANVGYGTQMIPTSDPDIAPSVVSYTVIEHFHEVEGRVYKLYPSYADAASGIDLSREAPVDSLGLPPPPPPGAPPGWDQFEDGDDATPVPAGVNGRVSVSGSPTFSKLFKAHGQLGVAVPALSAGVVSYDNPNVSASAASIYVWIGTKVAGSSNQILTLQDAQGNRLARVSLRSAMQLALFPGAGTASLVTGTVTAPLNQWLRIDAIAAWDGTNIYLQARMSTAAESLQPDQPPIEATIPSALPPLQWAAGWPNTGWGGGFDDVRLSSDPSWLGPISPTVTAPTLIYGLAGDPDESSMVVVCKVAGTSLCGLRASPNADMSGATTVPDVTVDANGLARFVVTGLQPMVRYWFQATAGGTPFGKAA